jgi:hypothetical protein
MIKVDVSHTRKKGHAYEDSSILILMAGEMEKARECVDT